MKKFTGIALSLILLVGCLSVFSFSVAADTAKPAVADMHSYLVGTQSGYTMENVADGVKFSKTTISGYENLGTNYGTKTYAYNGLRLEFKDILVTKGAGGETPRLSICLTPNTDGAIPRDSNNKGIVFIPASDWYGANKLGVYLGTMDAAVEGWSQGLNEVSAYQVTEGKAAFALLNATEAAATYTFEMYKDPQDSANYIVVIDDCAYYKIPATVIEGSLSKTPTASSAFTWTDLPAGRCVVDFLTWIPGGAYTFTWSGVTAEQQPTSEPATTEPPTSEEPIDPSVLAAALFHPYFATRDNYSITDVEKGVRFYKASNLSGYEFIGTNYDVRTYGVDGLRIEYCDIAMNATDGTAATSPRIGLEFTPYTDGVTANAAPNGIKGIIFMPAAGFFANDELIVYLGARASYPEDWAAGVNVIDPVATKKNAAPFGYMLGNGNRHSMQFNKSDDKYVICVDDCALYEIPATLIDDAITPSVEGIAAPINDAFLKADLEAGKAVVDMVTWTAGNSFDFTVSALLEGQAPVDFEDETEEPTETASPKTGDAGRSLAAFGVLLAAAALVIVSKKRHTA